MALDFPTTPVNGQEHTVGSRTYMWNAALGVWNNSTKTSLGAYTRQTFVLNTGEDTITTGYSPIRLEVHRQGVLMPIDEYVASNGTTIVFNVPMLTDGNIIEVTEWNILGLSNTYSSIDTDALLDTKAPQATTYTKDEVDTLLANKTVRNYTSQTTNYTAVAKDFIYADTDTTGAFTVTLPVTPAANTVVSILDVKGAFSQNNLTVARNGNTILGLNEDMVLDVDNVGIEFIYTGSDWRMN